jgi:HlyD family secretion protein
MNPYKLHYLFGATLMLIFFSCGKKDAVVDASGYFESTEILVSSEVSGKILQMDVTEGQQVKSGVALGIIDTTQLNLKKLQLKASIAAAQSRRPDVESQLAALRQQISTAYREKTRFENLVKANAANQKQLDDIDSQIEILEKQLAAQKTVLINSSQSINDECKALTTQIDQIEDQLKKSRICSPIDGVILSKYAEVGELVVPGKTIFKVADLSKMYLKAYITSDQLTKLKIGQAVEVVSEFGEKDIKTYKGTVSWISSKAEFTPKTVQTRDERANLVYAVKILVENDGLLKIGMYGGVRFEDDK